MKNYFEKALKVAELTKPKERKIHAVELWYKGVNVRNDNVVAFKITLDNGNNFIVNIYL